jgi:hypothetical protein
MKYVYASSLVAEDSESGCRVSYVQSGEDDKLKIIHPNTAKGLQQVDLFVLIYFKGDIFSAYCHLQANIYKTKVKLHLAVNLCEYVTIYIINLILF